MKRFFSCLVVIVLFLGYSRVGRADSLTLVSATGGVVGGEDIYPYNFSLNGNADLISLMCMNMNLSISPGETWAVNQLAIPLGDTAKEISYRADAYIYSLLGKYDTADIQYAVWSIFDPSGAKSNRAWNATTEYLASLGMQQAVDKDLTNSGFYSQFAIYAPTDDKSGWLNGRPQDLLGKAPVSPVTPAVAATPEPSSIALLGTGVLGAGVLLLYRRRAEAAGLAL